MQGRREVEQEGCRRSKGEREKKDAENDRRGLQRKQGRIIGE